MNCCRSITKHLSTDTCSLSGLQTGVILDMVLVEKARPMDIPVEPVAADSAASEIIVHKVAFSWHKMSQ